MKKVLLVVIDALATRVVEPALEQGRLPNFARLIEAGRMEPNCTSIFPSITPAATCSIITGCYPDEHGVAGAFWYDTKTGKVAFFGGDFWVVIKEGLQKFFDDFLFTLNHELLDAETIFERVESEGMPAACLNYIWFKGGTTQPVDAPWALKIVPGAPSGEQIQGTSILSLGDFTNSDKRGNKTLEPVKGGIFNRFGFHDDTTAEYLLQLVKKGMPPFTLAYFPNNDFDSHEVGPEQAVETLVNVDEHLGCAFDAAGGLETFLEDVAILITGDHSQCDMKHNGEAAIDLEAVLKDFTMVEAGTDWDSDEDVMACPNMRAAHLYLRENSDIAFDDLIERLLEEERVDQVIWRDRGEQPPRTNTVFNIATRDRGRLRFTLGGAETSARDEYGNEWAIDGDLRAVDATIDSSGTLVYGDYPNALERVFHCFVKNAGPIWITARLGHEFNVPRTDVHDGGSHGSLHRLDSKSPLIAAGLPDGVTLPANPRSIDIMPLCLEVLGLPPR